jgi:hypothetical protein
MSMDLDEDEIHWFPIGGRCPYSKKTFYHKDNKLVFDGYFYLEDQTMPVKRIMCYNQNMFLVEIISKKTLDDTSVFGEYDKELGGSVCFFPTNVIELQYKIIKKLANVEEFHKYCEELVALEVEIQERDTIHRKKREEEEFRIQAEEWKKIDYKKLMESLRDDDKNLDDI